ncbi:hypothetical protein MKI84_08550 [Ancylobacter sp. A5.8]|uniref:hypothetical protein n=1 Tax=Ancylobacter gelatini TaxID=2919920 RepID=UPI001F4ED841|nr:hypothetical protein [Ancylobacter gelatini]MCJ8142965.1 hypothetical protein [Ancylobacter gelatini]
MSQQAFIWRGPHQAASLQDAQGVVLWEGQLVPGRKVTGLPVDHPHVAQWVGARLLEPVAIDAPAEPAAEPAIRRRATKEG